MNNDGEIFQLRGPWNAPIKSHQNLIFLILIIVGFSFDPDPNL